MQVNALMVYKYNSSKSFILLKNSADIFWNIICINLLSILLDITKNGGVKMKKINKLQINTIIKIPKGKLELFKQFAAESIRLTSEKDTGVLKQDWFISNNQTEGVIREEYKNSEAVLEHMVNMSEIRELASNFSVDHVNVYGDPSPKLLDATKGADIRVYSFSQGLEEMIESV